MKKTVLASSLLLSLALGAFGEDRALLLSRISMKEQQLAKIQKEINDLRNQLSSAPVSKASYTVKAGDTIHSIARVHKVSPSDLMTWNKITDPTRLGVGETLTITNGSPAAVSIPRPPGTPAKPLATYTVEKGDTFYSIARRHNLSLKQLKALNPNVSTHLIAPGQTISVTGTAANVAAKPAPAPRQIQTIKEPTTHTIATKATAPKKPSTQVPAVKKPIEAPTPKPARAKPTPPAPAQPTPPVLEKPETGSSILTLYLKDEMTFAEFAEKHDTTTTKLNDLNGWNLPKATVLARGSEIQVPQ